MSDNAKKPEWTPEDASDAFASKVMRGVTGGHDGMPSQSPISSPQGTNLQSPKRRQFDLDEYAKAVLAGDRVMLARAITLIESNAQRHFGNAQALLRELLPHTGNAIRIGITGVPGAGKSTLIEALGQMLCDRGHKVAVLAVDPTSSLTRGSILGDKTRMEKLSREPNAFIRPSPTGGMLGGVARKTRETILLCEAAGFDIILVETVGTGQSEISVRSMVDFFLLVLVAGAGDELQGIKKGVVEIADTILINKADGENKIQAEAARVEYNRALHYLAPSADGWTARAYTGSALTGDGIENIWKVVQRFQTRAQKAGSWQARRQEQTRAWLHALIEEQLQTYFYNLPEVKESLPEIETAVINGTLPPTAAAYQLLQLLNKN